MRRVLMEDTRIVGVGEHMHGDLISWKWRLALLREIIDAGYDVKVLCEQVDMFTTNVAHPPNPPIRLEEVDGDPRRFTFMQDDYFYPHMINGSDRTREHFEITRAFSRFPSERCKFYGIDVQQLNFRSPNPIYDRAGREVKDALRDSGAEREWNAATPSDRQKGNLRNFLNAKMIMHFSTSTTKNEKKKKKKKIKNKILYFAHNEHVATDCANSREKKNYRTDGSWIREMTGHSSSSYLSLATFSEHTWSVHDALKPPLLTVDPLPIRHRPRTRTRNNAGGMIDAMDARICPTVPLGENYVSGDFDFVLMTPDGDGIRFS